MRFPKIGHAGVLSTATPLVCVGIIARERGSRAAVSEHSSTYANVHSMRSNIEPVRKVCCHSHATNEVVPKVMRRSSATRDQYSQMRNKRTFRRSVNKPSPPASDLPDGLSSLVVISKQCFHQFHNLLSSKFEAQFALIPHPT
jgi:hypothetical protein